jgi:hypothetical protein
MSINRTTTVATALCAVISGLSVVAGHAEATGAPRYKSVDHGLHCPAGQFKKSRYEGGWRQVEGSSGQRAGPFGALTWSKSEVSYRVRPGYVLELCFYDEVDLGIYEGAGGPINGPVTNQLRFERVVGMSYGYFEGRVAWADDIPWAVDAGL